LTNMLIYIIIVHKLNKMDNTDKKILEILQGNGRITNAELAKKIGLSPPTVLERVRKLEESGIIEKYIALINPQAVGRGTTAFVAVSLSRHEEKTIASFHQAILGMPEVLECYHITGEDDYLLKVCFQDIPAYRNFLMEKLTKVPGIAKIKTSFVLAPLKKETTLPVE